MDSTFHVAMSPSCELLLKLSFSSLFFFHPSCVGQKKREPPHLMAHHHKRISPGGVALLRSPKAVAVCTQPTLLSGVVCRLFHPSRKVCVCESLGGVVALCHVIRKLRGIQLCPNTHTQHFEPLPLHGLSEAGSIREHVREAECQEACQGRVTGRRHQTILNVCSTHRC